MGMMTRSVPEEIKSFKEKFFFGLTVRQLICAAAMLALAIPTGIFGSKYLSEDVVGWLIIIEVVPFAAIGWASYNDMPIEVIGKKIIAYYFGNQKRKFIYVSPNAEIHSQLQKIELAEISAARKEELRQEAERKKSEKREQKRLEKQRKKEGKISAAKEKTAKRKIKKTEKEDDVK